MSNASSAEIAQVVPLNEMTAEQLKEQRARLEHLGKSLNRLTLWARVALADHSTGSLFEPWDDLTPEQRREAYKAEVLLRLKEEARRFLKLLDPTAEGFTFQTFDDSKDKRRSLARVFNGTLDEHWNKLCGLNAQGAGIFITVNATDGKGRTSENIKRVRALFVDLDGAPLTPVMRSNRKPHIVVASSPGHFHPYMLVSDVKLEEFADLQKVLIARFDGDPKVFDLPRVMRLPGFFHCKDEPFLVHIISTDNAPLYKSSDFVIPAKQSDPRADYFEQAAEASKSPTQKLNDAALANLAAWVPELFPNAKAYHEGFRVSSADLGRDLEEDISFRRNGIKDFGVHDLDDPLEGKRTPVNLVMEHLLEVPVEDIAQRNNRDAFRKACDWLRERVEPEQEQDDPKKNEKPLLWFYVPKDPRKIPLREWMHAKHYIRKHVVMTSAPGDFGKTSLALCNAIEMATGLGLIGPAPLLGPYRVAYWNAEDPDEEIDRRIAAICLHHNIDQNLLKDHLIIGGMLPMGSRIAWFENGKVVFDNKLISQTEEYIKDFKIDCMIFDPLIAFHSVPENDIAMEKLLKQGFGQIAVKHDCCIELCQHMRKSGAGQYGGELSGDDSRGSSSIKDAVRSMRVLNRMSKDEASVANIPDEERRAYLRIDRGKGNMLPPQKATWFRLECVDLQNGDGYRPGDEVQVAEGWTYPLVIDAVNPDDLKWLLGEVSQGDYRLNAQAKDWVGYLLIRRLKLDPNDDQDKKRVAAVIKALLKNGTITTVPRRDKNSEWRDYVVPGEKKAPEGEEQ
jgi:hypothetical protein